ncbi:MAG: 2-amino-4-hydroxy-6-hydroxymethyldihydropteridine diphosphokinase [Sumerlaeia bacterium]
MIPESDSPLASTVQNISNDAEQTHTPAEALYRVVVALGSNIEPREERMIQAICLIDQIPQTQVLQTSACYKSLPWGDLNQADFLNAAVLLETALQPEKFLAETKEIEYRLGKEFRRHWGPREIDLDLIDFHGQFIETPTLKLPHPGAKDRPFVLLPLQDLGFSSPAINTESWSQEAEKCRAETTLFSAKTPWNAALSPRKLVLQIANEPELAELALALAEAAQPGMIFALDGTLGAGKTTFTRHFSQALGVKDYVSSPSFTLCQEYRGPQFPVVHWDFYRLQHADELESTGFELRPDSVMMIEWASLFVDSLPSNAIWIQLHRNQAEESMREFHIHLAAGFHLELRAALQRFNLRPILSKVRP